MFSDNLIRDKELLRLLPPELWLIIRNHAVKLLLVEKLQFPKVVSMQYGDLEGLPVVHIATLSPWHRCIVNRNGQDTQITYYWRGKPRMNISFENHYYYRYNDAGILIDDLFE